MRPYGRATPHQIIYATYLNCYWTYVRCKLTDYKSVPSQQNWQVIVRTYYYIINGNLNVYIGGWVAQNKLTGTSTLRAR